jgi:hypothetical protein
MKKILSKLKQIERTTIIRNSFLLPILSVVIMSISHVISWYDLGNPFLWAVYLSVAVEIFALASVSAASIKMKKGSIWLLFILVTFIQIVGNVFFTYQDIDIASPKYLSWIELIQPWFEDWSVVDHRRLLALVQGGTLPFMSLIALHFYIKFNENLSSGKPSEDKPVDPKPSPEENFFEDLERASLEDLENLEKEEVAEETVEETPSEIKEENKDSQEEKKDAVDQIHISNNEDDARLRRRLHASRY